MSDREETDIALAFMESMHGPGISGSMKDSALESAEKIIRGQMCRIDAADTMQAMLDEIERLQATVEHLQDICKEKHDSMIAMMNEALALRAALERYGHHLCTCSSLDKMDSGTLFHRSDWPCDCGFKEAHREALRDE